MECAQHDANEIHSQSASVKKLNTMVINLPRLNFVNLKVNLMHLYLTRMGNNFKPVIDVMNLLTWSMNVNMLIFNSKLVANQIIWQKCVALNLK